MIDARLVTMGPVRRMIVVSSEASRGRGCGRELRAVGKMDLPRERGETRIQLRKDAVRQ